MKATEWQSERQNVIIHRLLSFTQRVQRRRPRLTEAVGRETAISSSQPEHRTRPIWLSAGHDSEPLTVELLSQGKLNNVPPFAIVSDTSPGLIIHPSSWDNKTAYSKALRLTWRVVLSECHPCSTNIDHMAFESEGNTNQILQIQINLEGERELYTLYLHTATQ